jgi:YVTN family beta-propeller protein
MVSTSGAGKYRATWSKRPCAERGAGGDTAVATGGHRVYQSTCAERSVQKAKREQRQFDDHDRDVAVGAGGVWVANSRDGTVSRIDPESNKVIATIHIGNNPQGIAVGAGAVWVSVQAREPGGLPR